MCSAWLSYKIDESYLAWQNQNDNLFVTIVIRVATKNSRCLASDINWSTLAVTKDFKSCHHVQSVMCQDFDTWSFSAPRLLKASIWSNFVKNGQLFLRCTSVITDWICHNTSCIWKLLAKLYTGVPLEYLLHDLQLFYFRGMLNHSYFSSRTG